MTVSTSDCVAVLPCTLRTETEKEKSPLASGKPLKKVRDRDDKLADAKGKPEIFAAYKKQLEKKSRGFEAPVAIVDCVQAAVEKPFDDGLAYERERFQGLMRGTQAGAQRYYFFAEREAQKIPDVPKETRARDIKQVGILGAGTRTAVQKEQVRLGLPADGWPTKELLDAL